jgi:DNA-binding CsgD family transcriptional regulator
MDRKVNIIHGSVIVQNGLSNILRKNFKCKIKCFTSIESYLYEENVYSTSAILFVEDIIANSELFLEYLEKSSKIKSYCITNDSQKGSNTQSQYTINLYDSHDDIYEQIKNSFKIKEVIDEESEGLSNREIDVLKQVALGFSNKEIAEKLFISTHTVMSHRKNMTEKLGIKSISGLTVYAILNNYIDTSNIDIKDLI